jgi:hypothetical protein
MLSRSECLAMLLNTYERIVCQVGQGLGITEVDEGIWLASFMPYDLGYFGLEQRTLQPPDSPFGTRWSPVSWVRSVTDVSGPDNGRSGAAEGTRTPDPLITNEVLYQLSYRGGFPAPVIIACARNRKDGQDVDGLALRATGHDEKTNAYRNS